jgi:nitroreductase
MQHAIDEIAESPAFIAIADAIRNRRTVKQFLPEPPSADLIHRLLDLAVWAPNHRLTEPWRFYLIAGSARQAVGQIAAAITRDKVLAAGGVAEVAERKGSEAGAPWAAVPLLLFVTYQTHDNPEIDLENYGAVCCAIQNFMIAAHAAGLATSWNSGAVAASPELRKLVAASDNERMAGLIRVGYPDPAVAQPPARRAPAAAFTHWMDGQD